jgi:hypothetical protein
VSCPACGVYPSDPSPDLTAQYVPGTTRGSGNRKEFNFAALNLYRQQLDMYNPTYSGLTYYANGNAPTVTPGATGCSVNAPGVGTCLTTNLNQSMMHSPRVNNFDIHISREFHIHESMSITAIGQAFDLFGVQPEGGATGATVAAWGVPTSSGTTRQIGELAVKFKF